MDIICHSTQGFLLYFIPFHHTEYGLPLSILSGLIATIPDIVPIINDDWNFYDRVHHFRHWLSYVPPITLHVAQDLYLHGNNRWWIWRERMWYEILSWIVILILIILLILKII